VIKFCLNDSWAVLKEVHYFGNQPNLYNSLFLRGTLYNAGYIEALKKYNWDCFIFQDVDLYAEDYRLSITETSSQYFYKWMVSRDYTIYFIKEYLQLFWNPPAACCGYRHIQLPSSSCGKMKNKSTTKRQCNYICINTSLPPPCKSQSKAQETVMGMEQKENYFLYTVQKNHLL